MKYLYGMLIWILFILGSILLGGALAWAVGVYSTYLGYPRYVGGLVGTVIAYLVVSKALTHLHRKQAEQ